MQGSAKVRKARTDGRPTVRLVRLHQTVTRLRLKVDRPSSRDEMAALADRLARIAGVAHVVCRPSTGSVILTTADDPDAVLAAIESAGIARIEAAPKPPPVGQVLTLGMMQVDMDIRKRTENAFDLRTALVLSLMGAAIVQAARGQIAGQASTLAMAAFSILDTARR